MHLIKGAAGEPQRTVVFQGVVVPLRLQFIFHSVLLFCVTLLRLSCTELVPSLVQSPVLPHTSYPTPKGAVSCVEMHRCIFPSHFHGLQIWHPLHALELLCTHVFTKYLEWDWLRPVVVHPAAPSLLSVPFVGIFNNDYSLIGSKRCRVADAGPGSR